MKEPGMVTHVCNPSIWKGEAGRTQLVQGKPGLYKVLEAKLHSEILFQKATVTATKTTKGKREVVYQ